MGFSLKKKKKKKKYRPAYKRLLKSLSASLRFTCTIVDQECLSFIQMQEVCET